ncbi:TrmJ/YjtD family RNA methyltransferase [Sphingomonas donggukensis]|uniref:tRNA (cytidine/uridine-2'-O-)-methyltransferase TrmJ n=1 Tax=Sphingomonas donggukensis TaxID=2949093 RepID=A0ABY4TSP9_9SPHN|nr:TrmJ/YjtD family RNA methyltransferase [Sphingomonas donggukensis]URW74731.1 TrmJ/YjtD family RNA methyltransferase [Sphingomonas donggukensis]
MTFWTYILRCADGKYYTGHTKNLEARIAQHQTGDVPGWTSMRRPVELMWSEAFETREEAIAAEVQVGNWSRAKKEALFRGDWERVSAAARKPISRYAVSTSSTATRNERDGEMSGDDTPPPVIVLVRPQLGENIGKAARAMLNFGLTEMRLVSPRDGWPNPAAGPAASGADRVLADAQVFDSVADAVADCAHVYATTVRKRGITKPVVTPEEAAREFRTAEGRSAILFGPERSGLETDDVALARAILTVPINPEFGSLNLAQAVILVAYEWSKHQALVSPPSVDQPKAPAPQDELEGLIGQLDAMLETTGYYFPPHRVHVTKRTLRTLLTRPGWSSQEVRTMRGVLSALDGKKRPRE